MNGVCDIIAAIELGVQVHFEEASHLTEVSGDFIQVIRDQGDCR